MATENPAFADVARADAPSSGPAVDIEAALRGGLLTGDEAIVLMEKRMHEMEARLRAELGGGDAGLAAAVHGIVARLTETPANFHQATTFFLATDSLEDEAMARRAPLLFVGSLAMVVLQSAAAVGVLIGTALPSCSTSDQCGAGYFCGVGWNNRCAYCGGDVPLPLETEGACTFELNLVGGGWTAADATCNTRNNADDPNHVGFNRTLVTEVCTLPYAHRAGVIGGGAEMTLPATSVASWCETCVRSDGTVDPMTAISLMAANLAAMGPADHLALSFAAFIVAFTVVGELKDIELCAMAIAHAGDKLSKGWRLALGFLLWMRRWFFLPALVLTVPALVLYKGSDALSVCLNTVAMLFLCDIDNIAFDLALGERVRARVEATGHVELDDVEASALARTKAVHVALIVLVVVGVAWSGIPQVFLTFSPLALPLGGVVEAFLPGAATAETAKRVGKVLGAWLLGCVGLILVIMLLLVS
jgi:hypothetical protein